MMHLDELAFFLCQLILRNVEIFFNLYQSLRQQTDFILQYLFACFRLTGSGLQHIHGIGLFGIDLQQQVDLSFHLLFVES